jgi:signal transduction histidine kinase
LLLVGGIMAILVSALRSRRFAQRQIDFVSSVSHEFRTPLGITMSAVELLRNYLDQLNAAKRKELLDDIFNSTRHMASLM